MRKPYKMKGSAFYGKGNSSPAKVSDSEVREAVNLLNEEQLSFKMPGWAKAAGKIFTPPGTGGKGVPGGGGGAKGGKGEKTKVPKVETEHELDVNEDLMEGVPELETGSMGAGGFGGK